MVAGIDAATGKLRTLTDAEIQALSNKANTMATSRSSATPNAAWAKMPQTEADAAKTFRRHANGMTSAELPVSSMSSLTAEIANDGSLTILENGAPLGHGQQQVSK
ncbi:MAG: post-PEP-CTERM-1 domain-containing protein [Stenotrophomonas sp.]